MPKFSGAAVSPCHRGSCNVSSIPYQYMQGMQARRKMCVIMQNTKVTEEKVSIIYSYKILNAKNDFYIYILST